MAIETPSMSILDEIENLHRHEASDRIQSRWACRIPSNSTMEWLREQQDKLSALAICDKPTWYELQCWCLLSINILSPDPRRYFAPKCMFFQVKYWPWQHDHMLIRRGKKSTTNCVYSDCGENYTHAVFHVGTKHWLITTNGEDEPTKECWALQMICGAVVLWN